MKTKRALITLTFGLTLALTLAVGLFALVGQAAPGDPAMQSGLVTATHDLTDGGHAILATDHDVPQTTWPNQSSTDLVISKTVSPDTAPPGEPITYTLVYTNSGPVAATNVLIADVVPASVTDVSYTSSGADIIPIGGVNYIWQVINLPPASGGIITITGVLDAELPYGAVFTNTAAITSTTTDDDSSNNSSAAAVAVRGRVTGVEPTPNTHTAAHTTNLTTTASGPVSQASVTTQTFFVHGGFHGHLNGTFSFGSILFDPDDDFDPGELVEASVTDGVLVGDAPLASPYVWQFRTAVQGGSGIFAAHPISPTFGAGSSYGAALGDVDGDGDLDVVVANAGAPQDVYLNDGTGGFAAHPISPTFGASDSDSWAVALGDVDGDGRLDAIVANAGAAQDVYLNDGTGGFAAHPISPTFGAGDNSSRALALGDVDGDGDLDAIVANYGAPQDVYLNDGTGGFAPHPNAPTFGAGSSRGIDLGDVDGDGDLDAIVANDEGTPQNVYLNDGTGGFYAHPSASTFGAGNSFAVALGDVDGDGDLDAIVANYGAPQDVYLNDGAGGFAPHPNAPTFGAENASWGVALGDVDGDDHLDAIVANWNGSQSVYLNDGTGGFTAHHSSPTFDLAWSSSTTVVLGDVDADGDLDAIVANLGDSQTIWLNKSSADLAIGKSAASPTVNPGAAITYTLAFTNYGPQTATGVVITDSAPISITGVSWSGTANVRLQGGAYVWDVDDLDVGQGGVITITGLLDADLPGGHIFTNTATIATTVLDTYTVNNTSLAGVTVGSVPIILVTKTANVGTAEMGETITYTYRVTNTGNVTLDPVAAYDDKLGKVTLGASPLPPEVGTSGTLTYTIVEDDLPGPLVNTVTVTGTPPVGPDVTAEASFVLTLGEAWKYIYLPLVVKSYVSDG